jgi:putative FmdB family regulatory protein
MPIYEYRCQSCRKTNSIFFRSFSMASEPRCPDCGAAGMTRLISKALYLKPEAQRLAELDTARVLGGLDGSDVASFERWARRTGTELDSALGTNFRELADKAAAGEDPIERVDPGHRLRYAVDKKLSESSGASSEAGT